MEGATVGYQVEEVEVVAVSLIQRGLYIRIRSTHWQCVQRGVDSLEPIVWGMAETGDKPRSR